jgi:ATP-dependent RNA helicase DHX29
MSATLESDLFKQYFADGGITSICTISIPGRTFPVQVRYIEDAVQETQYVVEKGSEYSVRSQIVTESQNVKISGRAGKEYNMKLTWDVDEVVEDGIPVTDRIISDYDNATVSTLSNMNPNAIQYELIMKIIRKIHREATDQGSILVFLPGIYEIKRLLSLLNFIDLDKEKMAALPLHSILDSKDQGLVFKPHPDGYRKVILSTNIAETGITIPDIVYVIDTCRAKEVSFDDRRHVTRLREVWIAKANCKQRRGRAGRVQEGVCYHLVTKEMHDDLV